jgi:hypothetical protein
MVSWARIVNTTITNYLRDTQPAILRNRVLTGLLDKKGRYSFNNSGADFEWKIHYRRYQANPYEDYGLTVFTRKDRIKSPRLDWRSYEINDSVSDWEKLKNRGTEAIVKSFENMGKSLADDFAEFWATELYVDGNAAGNENRIHGVGSFHGNTPVAGQKFANPNDTYAGLATNLGTYGGSGPNWPDGKVDYNYDFFSPVVINYIAAPPTGFSNATPSWKNNCIEALRYGISASQRDNRKDVKLDVILMGSSMYRDFLSQLDSKERIQIQRGEMNDVVALGFTESVNFEGVPITWEVGCGDGDTTKAFGFTVSQMEIMCMNDQLFKMGSEYPYYDPSRKSYVVSVDFYGNAKFQSPRHFPLWDDLIN